MAIAARADRPVSFQQWNAITATPLDFRLDAGRYGLTTHASAWGTATLQRIISDGSGGQIAVTAIPALAGDGYAEIQLPAGWYRMVLAGITAFSGLIELINRGGPLMRIPAKSIFIGLGLLFFVCSGANAQQNIRVQAQAVASCGGQALTAGIFYPATQDLTGTLCTAGGGGGGTSYTVNYGAANSTKGTPSGFNDASGNFQPLLGDTINGQWVAVRSVASGALASGAGTDGWDVPEGHTTDTACPASGTATVVGCLRSAVNNPVTLGSASGGSTPVKLNGLGNTAVAIKSSAGQLYRVQCFNPDATHIAYIQIFNVAAGSVTVGTTAYTDFVGIPPLSNAGWVRSLVGDQYSTAISAAASAALTGSTGPTTALDCSASMN